MASGMIRSHQIIMCLTEIWGLIHENSDLKCPADEQNASMSIWMCCECDDKLMTFPEFVSLIARVRQL